MHGPFEDSHHDHATVHDKGTLALLAASSSYLQACVRSGAARKKGVHRSGLGGAIGHRQSSIAVLLQAPEIDVVGIGIVRRRRLGQGQHRALLRMMELTGHGKIPVAAGRGVPADQLARRDRSCGKRSSASSGYKGAWNPGALPSARRGADAARPGVTTLKPIDLHGALFMIQTVRKYPNEVTLWVGGPFTNVALALGLDPELAALAKELVLMGAGFNVDKGGNHRINGRREFNWWWDPEAVRMAMSAPWKKITITPVDISVKTSLLSDDMQATIAKSNSPTAQYHHEVLAAGAGGGGYMWDEIAAAAVIDPSIITKQQELYVNIDIDHGAGYGQTIFVEDDRRKRPAVVVEGVDGAGRSRQGQVLQAVRRPDVPAVEEEVRAGRSVPKAITHETNLCLCCPSGDLRRRSGSGATTPQKIIFDTDFAYPPQDDAMALFFVLNSPELQILGITTVAGNRSLNVATADALKCWR